MIQFFQVLFLIAAVVLIVLNVLEYNKWQEGRKEGSTKPLSHIPAVDEAAVKANTQLLHQTGETATPALLYCIKTPKGLVMQMKHGMDVHRTPEFIQKLEGSVGARGCIPSA